MGDDTVGHLAHRQAQVHRGLLDPAEGVRLAQSRGRAAATFLARSTRLAGLEPLGEVGHLGLERGNLGEPAHRHLDRRHQVGLGEGLDQVGHRAGVAGPLDEVALARRPSSITTGAIRWPAIRSAAAMPSSTGIFTSRMTRSGPQLLGEVDGLLAVAGLAHDVVSLVGQHLGEVHADQRLVLGDHDTDGRQAHAVRLSVPAHPSGQAVMGGRSRRAASSSTYSSISIRSSRARLQAIAASLALCTAVMLLARPHPVTALHGVHMRKLY